MPHPEFQYALATIGLGCCAAISADGRRRCSGFRQAEIHTYAPVVVDLTTAPIDQLTALVIGGPMVNPALPAGTVQQMFGNRVPFDATPDPARPAHLAFLGNAHSFDNVDVDTYLALARAVGATIVDRRGDSAAA